MDSWILLKLTEGISTHFLQALVALDLFTLAQSLHFSYNGHNGHKTQYLPTLILFHTFMTVFHKRLK